MYMTTNYSLYITMLSQYFCQFRGILEFMLVDPSGSHLERVMMAGN